MNSRKLRGPASVLVALQLWAGPATGQVATPPPAPDKDESAEPAPSGGPSAEPEARTTETVEEQAEVVLMLRGGREVNGLLVEDNAERVVLRIQGIDTAFPKEDLRGMRRLPPLMERYTQLRTLVGEDDLDGRVLLVEWLRTREQYHLALVEAEAVLSKDPLHPRAKELRAWLEQQVALQSKRGAGGGEDSPEMTGKERFADRHEAMEKFPLLRPGDINAIRVYEVDLEDAPRMLIHRETIDQLIRSYAESPLIPGTVEGREALYRQRPEQVLELMFRLQARELYPEVEVLDHPRAIGLFRNEVHGRWLINSCATAQCHGGQEAGRLWLYTDKAHSNETVYTNFIILERFKFDDGTPLINYGQPAKSPLIQMALPPEISLYPHPDVPRTRGSRGYRPVFRSTSDRRFRDAVEWISSMYQPRPEYPIEYTPPVPEPRAAEEPDR